MKQTFRVRTAMSEGAGQKETALTIDWEGCTIEILQQFATSGLIIKRQSSWRRKGIPDAETIRAYDHRPGVRVAPQPEDIHQVYARMTPAEQAAFINQHRNDA